jgi:hypothetical protein
MSGFMSSIGAIPLLSLFVGHLALLVEFETEKRSGNRDNENWACSLTVINAELSSDGDRPKPWCCIRKE